MEVSQQIRELLQRNLGPTQKITRQRLLIAQIFFDPACRHEHPTVEELYQRVRSADDTIGQATVYRTLKLFVSCGLASPRRLHLEQVRYEPELSGEHHDHLVCTRCEAIIEFHDEILEALQEEIAMRLGFILKDHRLLLYGEPDGICQSPQCPARSEGTTS